MFNALLRIVLVAASLQTAVNVAATCISPPGEPECSATYTSPWGYELSNGPLLWSTFRDIPNVGEKVLACAPGKLGHQSPLIIRPCIPMTSADSALNYVGSGSNEYEIFYDGHTIEAKPEKGLTPTSILDGKKWNLAQFHFHTPSEHTNGGDSGPAKRYPLEAHFVHSDPLCSGQSAVLGLWFKEEEDSVNPFLSEVTNAIKGFANCADNTTIAISEETFGPVQEFIKCNSKNIHTYKGSLTTPPCSEVVSWYVVNQPMTISSEQLREFRRILKHNSRCTESEWNSSPEGWGNAVLQSC